MNNIHPRVPINEMDKLNLMAGIPGIGHRTARYYNYKVAGGQLSMFTTENIIDHKNTIISPNLGDPLVIAPLIAGLVGITVTIIIILSIWILKRSKYSKEKILSVRSSCTSTPVEVVESIVISSVPCIPKQIRGKETTV